MTPWVAARSDGSPIEDGPRAVEPAAVAVTRIDSAKLTAPTTFRDRPASPAGVSSNRAASTARTTPRVVVYRRWILAVFLVEFENIAAIEPGTPAGQNPSILTQSLMVQRSGFRFKVPHLVAMRSLAQPNREPEPNRTLNQPHTEAPGSDRPAGAGRGHAAVRATAPSTSATAAIVTDQLGRRRGAFERAAGQDSTPCRWPGRSRTGAAPAEHQPNNVGAGPRRPAARHLCVRAATHGHPP